jgi:recombinational DNA repair protein RecR
VSSFAPPIQRLVTELSKLPGVGSRTAQRLAFHILRASHEDALGLADAIREVKEKVGLCEVCFNLADEPRCRICQDPRRDPSVICVVEEPSDVIPMERTHEFHGLYHVLGGALSPIDGIEPDDLKIDELYERVLGGETPVHAGGEPEGDGGDLGAEGSGGVRAQGDEGILAEGDGGGHAEGDGGGRAQGNSRGRAEGDGGGVGEMASPSRTRGAGLSGDVPALVREVVLATNPTTTGEATALHIAAELRRRADGRGLTITRLASGLPVGSDLEYADEVTLGKALAGRRSL